MRNKLLTTRGSAVAGLSALLALCTAFSVTTAVRANADYNAAEQKSARSAEFVYDSDDETVIVGINASEGEELKLTVPSSVTKIGAGAFKNCENLVSLVFEGESVTEIGEEAFSGCTNLNYVALPDNAAEIEYGENAFGTYNEDGIAEVPGYLIMSNIESYSELTSSHVLAQYLEKITYTVKINYISGETVLATETRLSGTDYSFRFIDGKWDNHETTELVPAEVKGYSWYYENEAVDVDKLTELLNSDGMDDAINLYAFDSGEKKFTARNDIVYSGRAYETYELNELLSDSGDKIEAGMTVEISGYTAPDGAAGDIPYNICDAGVYEITVTAGEAKYVFNITVAKQSVDLGEYANLSWVGETTALRDMNLYLYEKNDGGKYPSLAQIAEDQFSRLDLNGKFTVEYVNYSVIGYDSGNEVTVSVKDNPAYSVSYPTDGVRSASEVGIYQAKATLTPDINYVLEANPASELRGLKIEENADGTFSITKNWYIVNITNWLVTEEGGDIAYSIPDFEFGETPNVGAPKLRFVNYDNSETSLKMELYLDGKLIGTALPSLFADYINATMPAGEYKLVVTVGAVTSADSVELGEPVNPVYRAGFTESFNFTVRKKMFSAALNGFFEALNGSEFKYKWDGDSHLFEQSAEATKAYSEFLDNYYNPARVGIWARFPEYYGTPALSYNLVRMQSAAYTENVNTNAADTYTVYYKVSAPNYFDSIENLAAGDSRTNYVFTVINVKEVTLPVIDAKKYTGGTLTADVNAPADDNGTPLYYTVISNAGGTGVGTYDVVLELIDPVHYMWEGQTVENKTVTATVKFNIDKSSDNYFTTTLGITTWVAGKYGELESFPVAAESLFGSVVIKLSYSDDITNVIYEGANGTLEFSNALAELKAGSYILTATVADAGEYNGIFDVITFKVFEKDGLPWWAVVLIVAAALGVVALIFFILHQKGVLQMLTGKFLIAMRTKATVDATIAAVRANKVAAEAKKSVARAEAIDRLEAARAAQADSKAMTAEEQAAALEEKAALAAKSAERMQKRANSMQKKADKIKKQAEAQNARAESESTATADEQTVNGSDGETADEQPKD